jgi:hypothetical protein
MTTATAALRGPLRKRESNLWEREADDWYVEPEWCSLRLFQEEKFEGCVYDPAAGRGTIVISALKSGLVGIGSDIVDRGWDSTLTPHDFLQSEHRRDNIVTNPPFGIAEKFLDRALDLARNKVALLLPANWVQGDKRSRMLQHAAAPRLVHHAAPLDAARARSGGRRQARQRHDRLCVVRVAARL